MTISTSQRSSQDESLPGEPPTEPPNVPNPPSMLAKLWRNIRGITTKIITPTSVFTAVGAIVFTPMFGDYMQQNRERVLFQGATFIVQLQQQRDHSVCDRKTAPLIAMKALERIKTSSLSLSYFDLSNLNLNGVNLQSENWFNIPFVPFKSPSADLQNSNLSCASLVRAKLQGVDLSGADLRRADLKWANLTDANLTDAKLDNDFQLTDGMKLCNTTGPDGKKFPDKNCDK
jgi:hypothetical protein